MSAAEWKVPVGDGETSAAYESGASGSDVATFVCAHGAGGRMSDRGILATAAALRAHGIGVVRFNFLYAERGQRRPDPMPKLMETTRAVVERVRAELHPQRLIITPEPPSIDANEITDKGYMNQRAVLERRAALVEKLYAGSPEVVSA